MSRKSGGPYSGEWLDYRRDHSRQGNQSVSALPASSARRLREKWRIPIGGSYQEVLPVGDASGDLLLADGGGIQRISTQGEYRWKSPAFGAHWITGVFDLDDDGRLEIVTSNGRELVQLSAETGDILFRFSVGPGSFPVNSYGTYAPMFQVHRLLGRGMQILIPAFSHKEVLLFDCANGAERTTLLHKLWMDDGYHPSITIGDVNHDGLEEVVIARLGGVYVFDPKSGAMLSQTIWKSDEERRRNYGHFELADIDCDGNLEAVILSDKVTRHIAVLDNDGRGNFTPLWDRFIEHIYPLDSTELRFTSNSICDLDGDGNLEIAVSLFNDRKDNAWRTEIIHATTGETLREIPEAYLHGVQDFGNSSILCLSQQTTRVIREHSTISLWDTKKREPIWSRDNSHFADRTIRANARAAEFKPDVFSAHEVWKLEDDSLLIQTRVNGSYELGSLKKDLDYQSLNSSAQHSRVAWADASAIVLSYGDGSIARITESGEQALAQCGYHLTTEAHIAARPGPTAIVFNEGDDRYIAVPDFANNTLVFRTSGPTTLPEFHATIPGRGRLGYDGVFHSPGVIETSTGKRLVVIDDRDLEHSRVSLYTPNGECDRSYDFPDLPPSIVGNRIGCYDWLAFEHTRGPALMFSFYRSFSMNSECTLAVLLATGEVIWRIDQFGEGDYGRGIGPWGTSSLRSESGKPIAYCCAKDTLLRIDLETGVFATPPQLLTKYTADEMRRQGIYKEQGLSTWSSIEDPFTAYGTPVLVGRDTVIAGCFGGLGVLDENSSARWWRITSFGDVLYRLPAIADIDNDGRLEFGQGHADGSFRIYDYLTGDLRSRLQLNAIATDILSVDINSDGASEFIVTTNDGRLLVIGSILASSTNLDGSSKECCIFEEHNLGEASLGSPIAADIDGDGRTELLIVSASGQLICVA